MNQIEWSILLALTLAGLFLLFLRSVKSKSNKKEAHRRSLFGWIWYILFPSPRQGYDPIRFPKEEDINLYRKPGEKVQLPKDKFSKTKQKDATRPDREKPTVETIEVFDYNGVKIMHESGIWTVNDGGIFQVYKEWSLLPPKYQKMVKELDNRSLQNQKSSDYFVEMINGFYYVSLPGGKKKKYKSYADIPPEIKKFLDKE